MTNEELIAQARELCETIGEFAINEIDEWEINLRSSPDNKSWKDRLATATGIYRLVTTHLAEMDEIEAKLAETGKAFTHDYMKMELGNFYREQLLTKAKRLLGARND